MRTKKVSGGSLGKATRLRDMFERHRRPLRSALEQEAATVLLAERYENGRDLFGGEPLEGEDADDWLRLQYLFENRVSAA